MITFTSLSVLLRQSLKIRGSRYDMNRGNRIFVPIPADLYEKAIELNHLQFKVNLIPVFDYWLQDYQYRVYLRCSSKKLRYMT